MRPHQPKTCKWFPVCPMKAFYEAGKLDSRWIKDFCQGNWPECVRYQQEEAKFIIRTICYPMAPS